MISRHGWRVVWMSIIGIIGVISVHAQDYIVTDPVRIPAESFVGDPVELRFRLPSGDTVISGPDTLPEPPWGTIESVLVTELEQGYDVRVVVKPFEPGALAIPRLQLGEATVDGLTLVVTSVLDDLQDQSLRSIYGPQRLPGTRALLVLTAVAITTALFALYYLLGPGQKQIRMLIGRLKAQLPYRRLSRRLTVLEAEGATLDAREFYIRLVDAIQDYMTAILRVDCHAATTSELHQYLPTLATYSGAPVNQASPLRDVLRAADRAKFAHESIEPRTRELHVRTCGEVFQELETHRRRVRKRRKARGAYVGS